MTQSGLLKNYINGEWVASEAGNQMPVDNPATGEVLGHVPISPKEEVDQAAQAAAKAFEEWRRVPPPQRVQYLFKLKDLLETHLDELAEIITQESGKTLAESKGELRRAIENVEVACGIPMMMQGTVLEDIASGIDEF
jgi:malonate-semialdehyde dehydrogenase (acetylating)/methylmalonate-semialdehyde dehydrogenase